ncbi:endonuclease domain-containing protein, partial [Legionella moravica]
MGLTNNAKSLRKNSSCMEIKIWTSPGSQRVQGVKFRRQCPIGTYIVDFVCIEKKLGAVDLSLCSSLLSATCS